MENVVLTIHLILAVLLTGVVLLLAAVVLLASLVPARRAARVSPLVAMRVE